MLDNIIFLVVHTPSGSQTHVSKIQLTACEHKQVNESNVTETKARTFAFCLRSSVGKLSSGLYKRQVVLHEFANFAAVHHKGRSTWALRSSVYTDLKTALGSVFRPTIRLQSERVRKCEQPL